MRKLLVLFVFFMSLLIGCSTSQTQEQKIVEVYKAAFHHATNEDQEKFRDLFYIPLKEIHSIIKQNQSEAEIVRFDAYLDERLSKIQKWLKSEGFLEIWEVKILNNLAFIAIHEDGTDFDSIYLIQTPQGWKWSCSINDLDMYEGILDERTFQSLETLDQYFDKQKPRYYETYKNRKSK